MIASTASSLVLSVVGDHAGDVSDRTSVRVDGHDLSIGRADHCDWVLHAHGVSRQHAVVRHLNGLYFLEDRSTNGMLLNGVPLRGGEPVSLSDGDRLQLDTFEILVAVVTLPGEVVEPAGHVAADDDTLRTLRVSRREPAVVGPAPSPSMVQDVSPSLIPGAAAPMGSLDPLAWLSGEAPAALDGVRTVEPSARWSHASPMDEHFDAPQVDNAAMERREPSVLPEHWDRTRSVFTAPAPAPSVAPVAPVLPDAAPAEHSPTLAGQASPSGTANVEALFTLVLEGVMDVLRARAELKNGFRLPATLIQRRENNPLKFAPTGGEALARLLAAPNEAFLSGEAAVVDAMDDIRLHQVALLSGVRAAFDDLIAQFDPARFEEDPPRRTYLGFSRGKDAWARYRAHFEGLAADPEQRFRRLFGDEFARAYEDQLARAKRDGR